MKKFLSAHSRLCVLLLALTVSLFLLFRPLPEHYLSVDASTRSYRHGVVIAVSDAPDQEASPYSGRMLGTQNVTVDIGGETVEISNSLSDTHYIRVKVGTRVIVCVDAPANTAPYYSIFNYDRTAGLLIIFLVFAALMLLIGRQRGFYSLAALVFSVLFLLRFTIPAIFCGHSVLLVTAVTILVLTLISIGLISGVGRKSMTSSAVVLIGEGLSAVLFAVFSSILHINGFVDENVDSLLLITQFSGLDLMHLLFAAAMIASLGAVMDVAVSLVAAVFEVYDRNPSLSRRELFRSGMNVGRDMMGTMSNTLILAFAGSSLSTMLVLFSYGVQSLQLLSSDYIAVEITHGLCGTAAVILSVPLSAALSALVLKCTEKQAASSATEKAAMPSRPLPRKEIPR